MASPYNKVPSVFSNCNDEPITDSIGAFVKSIYRLWQSELIEWQITYLSFWTSVVPGAAAKLRMSVFRWSLAMHSIWVRSAHIEAGFLKERILFISPFISLDPILLAHSTDAPLTLSSSKVFSLNPPFYPAYWHRGYLISGENFSNKVL